MAKKPAKKAASKKKEDESKKKPAKKTTAKKTTAKKSARKTSTSKPKAAAKPRKTSAAKSKTAKSKKKPAKTSRKKVSMRDLLLKKFEKLGPEKTVSFERPKAAAPKAPALISEGDPQEAERLRTLLLKKFDYAELAAAAERAAREKARAEKAAAEKAAREKARAEKAAAEKAAREKAQAEKAAAEKVTVTYATDEEGTDTTMDKTTKILAAAVIGVLLLIGAASMSNMGNYYLRPTNKALEIWRGKFAPKGQKLFMKLPGVKAPENIKPVYSKKDIYPLIFGHYVARADALLAQNKMPDFAAIRSYLDKAAPFAVTPELKDSISARLRTLDLMVLLYKAEAAASARTKAGFEKALAFLASADRMARSEAERALVAEKKMAVDKALAAMRKAKAQKAAAPKKPAPQHKAS